MVIETRFSLGDTVYFESGCMLKGTVFRVDISAENVSREIKYAVRIDRNDCRVINECNLMDKEQAITHFDKRRSKQFMELFG